MEDLPRLPSVTGDTDYSPCSCSHSPKPQTNNVDHQAGNSSTIDDDSSCGKSSTSSQLDEITIVDRLNQEIEDLRSAGLTERNHYISTTLELNRLQKIVEACDASYRCLDYYHSMEPRSSLSEIATAVIERWAHNKERTELEKLQSRVGEQESRMKGHCRNFFRANLVFSDVATKYYKEVERYAMWTVATATKLRSDYAKYCRIMKEHGLEPESLCEEDEVLENMQHDLYTAWDQRNIAMRRAMEAAHLDGHPNMLENLFGN